VSAIVLAAALTAISGCPVERIASVHLVDVRVVRRREADAVSYDVSADDRTSARIAFAQQGITVSGLVGSDDPRRVDIYARRGPCERSERLVKTFDPQTGLLVP
jgi:hypothetical protein